MNTKEIEKIILADGQKLKSVKGDHFQYVHPTKPGKVTIPSSKRSVIFIPKPQTAS